MFVRLTLVVTISLAALVFACKPKPQVDPKVHAEGLYVRGMSDLTDGKIDEALAAFSEAKKLSPEDKRLPASLGEVHLAQRKLVEAEVYFQEAVRVDPARAASWSRLGMTQVLLGKREAGKAALEKAIGLNPKDVAALENLAELELADQNLNRAIDFFSRAARVSPEPGASELWTRAAAVLDRFEQRPRAAELLQGAIDGGARSPDVFGALGDVLAKLGRASDAAAAYQSAAEASEKDSLLWELAGHGHLRAGHTREGEVALRRSIELADRAGPRLALARLYLSLGQRSKANDEITRAVDLVGGDDAAAIEELGDLLVATGQQRKGLQLLETLASEPGAASNVALQLKTARLAQKLGDHHRVREVCLRVRSFDAGVRSCP